MSGDTLTQNLIGIAVLFFVFAIVYAKMKGESLFDMLKSKMKPQQQENRFKKII